MSRQKGQRDHATPKRLAAIRMVYKPGISQREIAEAIGVSKSVVSGLYLRYRNDELADCPAGPKVKSGKHTRHRKYMDWTPEKIDLVAKLMKDGLTGQQIGDRLNCTRDAIIGLSRKHPKLKDIGLARGRKYVPLCKTEEERAARRLETRKRWIEKRRAEGRPIRASRANVGREPDNSPIRRQFKPVVVSNNTKLMIEDWIAANGVRRFEAKDSSEYFRVQAYLAERGWQVSMYQSRYSIVGPNGRKREAKWRDVLAVADRYRMAEGLEPFLAA